jgi:hypothetical protein
LTAAAIAALALLCQLDPASGGTLPGYDPGAWRPAPPVRAKEVPAGPWEYSRVYDSADATAWAYLDLMTLKRDDPTGYPFYRWVWIPPHGDVTWLEANSLVVNTAVSQANLIVLPDVPDVGGGWLLRWDLRKLAPKPHQLHQLLVTWNALHVNNTFHVQLPIVNGVQTLAKTEPFQGVDGKTYHAVRFLPAPHLKGYEELQRATSVKGYPSLAPLVRADDLLRRASSTIEGGLYYHFIGFIRDGKRLSEKEVLQLVGLDVALSRRVEGDNRAGLFQRGPTGSPGAIEQVQGAVGRARISYDVFAEDVDASRHVMYNLIDITERARGKEIIFERPNGTQGFLLADGKGSLVDEAPPNLASDHRVPAPHHPRLVPMIGCVRCHGPHGGVQPVRNDVAVLLDGGEDDADLLDDLSIDGGKVGRQAIVDRVAGLYRAGDQFNEDLEDSRNRLADAVFLATRGSGALGEDRRATVTSKAYANIAAQYAGYWYAKSESVAGIDAERALLEWGYRAKQGEGRYILKQLMPAKRVDVYIDGHPVELNDPSIVALMRGLTIRRQDYQRVHALGAYVISKNRPEPGNVKVEESK